MNDGHTPLQSTIPRAVLSDFFCMVVLLLEMKMRSGPMLPHAINLQQFAAAERAEGIFLKFDMV
jgi:hypothetical protein